MRFCTPRPVPWTPPVCRSSSISGAVHNLKTSLALLRHEGIELPGSYAEDLITRSVFSLAPDIVLLLTADNCEIADAVLFHRTKRVAFCAHPDAGGLEISSFETVGVDDDIGGLSHKAELIILLIISAKWRHRKDQSHA